MPEPHVLVEGLAFGESPRWRENRLWFSNWARNEIVVDSRGNAYVNGSGSDLMAGEEFGARDHRGGHP